MPAKSYLLRFIEQRKNRLPPNLIQASLIFANHLSGIKRIPWAAIPNTDDSIDILWDLDDLYIDIGLYGNNTYSGYCKINVDKYRHILLKYNTAVLTTTFDVNIDDRSIDLALPSIVHDILISER